MLLCPRISSRNLVKQLRFIAPGRRRDVELAAAAFEVICSPLLGRIPHHLRRRHSLGQSVLDLLALERGLLIHLLISRLRPRLLHLLLRWVDDSALVRKPRTAYRKLFIVHEGDSRYWWGTATNGVCHLLKTALGSCRRPGKECIARRPVGLDERRKLRELGGVYAVRLRDGFEGYVLRDVDGGVDDVTGFFLGWEGMVAGMAA